MHILAPVEATDAFDGVDIFVDFSMYQELDGDELRQLQQQTIELEQEYDEEDREEKEEEEFIEENETEEEENEFELSDSDDH